MATEPLISIPRRAVAELLQAAGSPLTPEEYLASLPELSAFERYPSRVRASAWSKNILMMASVISVLCLPFDFDVAGLIGCVILVAITAIEYRVNRFFREQNQEAPTLGFRNQLGLAIALLVYGLYHAFLTVPLQLSPELMTVIDAPTLKLMRVVTQVGYVVIGVVGAVSQFALAWYYRSARL